MHFDKKITKDRKISGVTRIKGDRFFLATKNLKRRKENLIKTCSPLFRGLALCVTRSIFSWPGTVSIPTTTNLTDTHKALPQLEPISLGNTNLVTDTQISMACSSLRALSVEEVVKSKSCETVTTKIYWNPSNNAGESGSRRLFSYGCKGIERATKSCGGIILSDIAATGIVNTKHNQRFARRILKTATGRSDFSKENHTIKSVRISGVAQLVVICKDKNHKKCAIYQNAPVGRALTFREDEFYYIPNTKVNNRDPRLKHKILQRKRNGWLDNLENSEIHKISQKGNVDTYYLTSHRTIVPFFGKMGKEGHFVSFESNVSSLNNIFSFLI
jgi:hypothetical protein